MRFRLVLENTSSGRFLPINHQYAVSSWIYKKIQETDPEYSHFLHKGGYEVQNRQYKLFTFGQIESYPFKIHNDRLEMKSTIASIILSFMADRAAETFIKGIFMNQIMPIKDPIGGVVLHVSRVETLPYPVFNDEMEYQLITPICISHRGPTDKQPQYLSPDDNRYKDLMINNMVRKYSALQLSTAGGMISDEVETCDFDFKLLSPPKQKLVTIKPYTDIESKVRGYVYRFKLKAPIALQELGYYSGFGEKNSMGFGCGEVFL